MQQSCSCVPSNFFWVDYKMVCAQSCTRLPSSWVHYLVRTHDKVLPLCTSYKQGRKMHVCLCAWRRDRRLRVSDASFDFLTERHPLYRRSASFCVAMVSPWDRLLFFLSFPLVLTHTDTHVFSHTICHTHWRRLEIMHTLSVPLFTPKQQHKLHHCNTSKHLVTGFMWSVEPCCNVSRVDAPENRSLLYIEIFPNHITVDYQMQPMPVSALDIENYPEDMVKLKTLLMMCKKIYICRRYDYIFIGIFLFLKTRNLWLS